MIHDFIIAFAAGLALLMMPAGLYVLARIEVAILGFVFPEIASALQENLWFETQGQSISAAGLRSFLFMLAAPRIAADLRVAESSARTRTKPAPPPPVERTAAPPPEAVSIPPTQHVQLVGIDSINQPRVEAEQSDGTLSTDELARARRATFSSATALGVYEAEDVEIEEEVVAGEVEASEAIDLRAIVRRIGIKEAEARKANARNVG